LVADADGAAPDDVCAKSSAVHERSQDAAAVEAVEVGARFAQAAAAAARFAERELAADEGVEVGASHDDVAAVVEVAVERVEDGGVDERQRAAWPAGGPVPRWRAPRSQVPPALRRPGR
jgi:hypothetical protein